MHIPQSWVMSCNRAWHMCRKCSKQPTNPSFFILLSKSRWGALGAVFGMAGRHLQNMSPCWLSPFWPGKVGQGKDVSLQYQINRSFYYKVRYIVIRISLILHRKTMLHYYFIYNICLHYIKYWFNIATSCISSRYAVTMASRINIHN